MKELRDWRYCLTCDEMDAETGLSCAHSHTEVYLDNGDPFGYPEPQVKYVDETTFAWNMPHRYRCFYLSDYTNNFEFEMPPTNWVFV